MEEKGKERSRRAEGGEQMGDSESPKPREMPVTRLCAYKGKERRCHRDGKEVLISARHSHIKATAGSVQPKSLQAGESSDL